MAFKVTLPKIYLGAAYKKSFLWFSEDASGNRTPVSLEGLQGRIQLKRKAGALEALADWSTANGKLIFDANKITIEVPRADTDAYTFKEAEWDLVVWPTGQLEAVEVLMLGVVPTQRVVTDVL